MRLTGRPFRIARGDKRACGQLGQGHGRDQRFLRQRFKVSNATQEYERAGVENAFCHHLQRVVEELFEITTQRDGIDVGELPTSIDQNIEGYCRSVEWSKLGDRSAAPGDRDPLAVRHAIDDIAADQNLTLGQCRTAGKFKTTDCR